MRGETSRARGTHSRDAGHRPFHWWPPFYRWSVRRRFVVAGIVAMIAGVLANAAWMMADSSSVRAGKNTLADAKQRLAAAQRQITELPALRKTAQAESSASPHDNNNATAPHSADDIRFLSQLATETGVTLLSLEPGAENRKEPSAGHFLKLTAQTDFVHLNDFFRQLRALPVLVVPVEVTIRRNDDGLAVTAMLQSFDALHAPAVATEDEDTQEKASPGHSGARLIDPFEPLPGDTPSSKALRLAGVIEDGANAIALMETPDGMQTVKRGDALGGERVARIGMPEIVLSRGVAMRALPLEEEDEKKSGEKK